MKTLQIIRDDQKTPKTEPNRKASDVERFINSQIPGEKIEWETSKSGIIDELDEARNYSKQPRMSL